MNATDRLQIVTFRVGDDLFASDVQSVERVLRYTAPRAIPNVPAWLQGVIDYRGRVVPVIDLRQRFELPPVEATGQTRILVLVVGEEWVGAVVDAVFEVASVAAAEVAPPPSLFRGLAGEYVRGVVRQKEGLVVLLDVARVLSSSDRIAIEQAAAEAGDAPEATPADEASEAAHE
ncbi:MAG: chemotaxis protein CheW [Gemmatimonadaceae bacterium]